MTPPSGLSKPNIRRAIRERLAVLSPADRAAGSLAIRQALTGSDLWRHAGSVLLFAALPDEVDLLPLVPLALAAGKQVALPRFQSGTDAYEAARIEDPARDCVVGRFGVREPGAACVPLPLNRLDLVLVPGVAFSPEGWRLGRGKGYYDRLLNQVRGVKCGIGFDCQVVESLPTEPHDVRLNCILTPSRWLSAGWTPRGV